MDCPRFQHWARVCLNVFVEGDPHRFDRDQSKAKPGGGEKEGANPALLRGILAVVGGGCIQRAEELGQPSPSCENLFLKVHVIGGSHDQVGRCWLCFDCCNIGAGHVARAASSPGGHDHSSPSRVRPGYAHGQWVLQDDCHAPPSPAVFGVGCRACLSQVGLRRLRQKFR